MISPHLHSAAGIYTDPPVLDNPVVTLFEFFYSKQQRRNWNSWWSLYMAAPCAFGLLLLVPTTLQDAAIGNRQQTTAGIITAYEPNNHDSCRYAFSAQGKQFGGIDGCPRHPGAVGSTVKVYFDPTNPAKSVLEDFSVRGRRNRPLIYLCAIEVAAVFLFVIFIKISHRDEAAG